MSKALRKTLSLHKRSLLTLNNDAANFTVLQPNSELPLADQVSDLDVQRRKLLNHRARMEQRISQMREYHNRWLTLLGSTSNSDAENAFYEQVTTEPDNFLDILMHATDTIANLNSHIQQIDDTVAEATMIQTATPPLPEHHIHHQFYDVRLPKLQIKPFNGDLNNWPHFKASFEAAVGNHPDIPPIQKLNYLLSLLEGPAARAVAGYDLNPHNYAIVWRALEEQFGSHDAILSKLYTQLDNLRPAERDIRSFVDNLECILCQLETQGENLETRQMHRLIEKKLPYWVILEILDEKEKVTP
ncbi:hypothetical protein AB6A40_011223 [Gnathostoma spinigerum]|uniref:Retrotransposon gag domain-containing protein n=1 Tax=Gnathostoma spinigerum TaxID=75299 RepID=A0ABD6F309_9BILA